MGDTHINELDTVTIYKHSSFITQTLKHFSTMEGVSSTGVEVIVQKLINVLRQEYSLFRGLDREARKLQETLQMIKAYMGDAEKKPTSQAVKIWLIMSSISAKKNQEFWRHLIPRQG